MGSGRFMFLIPALVVGGLLASCKDKVDEGPADIEAVATGQEEANDDPVPARKAPGRLKPNRPSPAAMRQLPTQGSSPDAAAPPDPTITPAPAVAAVPVPTSAPAASARLPIPDLRLLLTATDLTTLAPKQAFHKSALAGTAISDNADGLYFAPEKASTFGVGIQVFRARDASDLRERFSKMTASYPSAVDLKGLSDKAFFAYWGEVLSVGFTHPGRSLAVVVSCGRKFCDSDAIYQLAKTVHSRIH